VNILFILPQIEKGGGQTIQALNLAENLIKRNNNIYILTFRAKGTGRELPNYTKKLQIFSYDIRLNYYNFLVAPFLVNKVKDLVEKWKIDIIQSFDPHISNLIAIFLGRSLKIPVFCRIGGKYLDFYEDKLLKGNIIEKFLYYIKVPSIILNILEYFTIKRTKALISNCSYILKSLKQSFLMKHLNFNWKVIPNGVDLEKFALKKQQITKELSDLGNKSVLLYIGRIEDYKGIDTLIQALDLVRRRVSDVRLLLVGSYEYNKVYYENLCKLIKKLRLTQYIRFEGEKSHSEIPHYLQIAKILILPSYLSSRPIYEGCPNVILEAMACHRLVIASNIGGIPEIIKNNKNGFLFEPKNSFQLAELILSVLENPEKFQALVENGRKLITRNYAFEIITEKYLEIYRRSLSIN
jgi:glycosyltransferase involved in cell wall biosynthesis